MTKAQRKKEFIENRTSWKFFQRNLYKKVEDEEGIPYSERLLLEILKELQFLNDK